jgi:hypothetical protein
MMKNVLSTAIVFALALATAHGASAAPTKTYGFLTHAAFFSVESRQANLIDPQAFVADAAAVSKTGPQGIVTDPGYRPAFGVDDPSTPIFSAVGVPLGLTLSQWFGARGTVALTDLGATTGALFSFSGLIHDGHYSLFENHFSESGVTFTPLDGSATTNSFVAAHDGSASVRLTIPGSVTHAEGLLLVYHSDGRDHGMQRGKIGVDAHHQLIVRVP